MYIYLVQKWLVKALHQLTRASEQFRFALEQWYYSAGQRGWSLHYGTIVKADANIDVSSQTGKGGTTVIWSDQVTEFDGQINAKGAEKIAVSANLNDKKTRINMSNY